ncbi:MULTISPECIES: sulfite exporter TauE/SafE family protein [unclassified Sphingobium]|uniref:sulfite exporter TauE/SafE family protein n=1 Tax=unclassified Sphingobium TaxID=2611147 RepID=UPI0022258E2C|nr:MULTISPECIES: sulfite exporter TauE/SafE family protein [unclassified Sphingobium]MCW2396786.1 putative membrane protein YfcA [Sphingobium sp. B8D3B]MCW2420303.1 putative membrane protein YfcA [Sphingobium sp. B8D3C]
MTGVLIIIAAFATAFLSGIFGMAGGLLLMGILAFLLPVSAAFVTHGILQLVANGWRAVVHREHVVWPIMRTYALGVFAAGAVVAMIGFSPSRPLLFLLLGLVPLVVWLPRRWIALDASRPSHAFLAGFTVSGLNLTAGVAGPMMDVFFVRTPLTRHQIVSTKAAGQVFSHIAKIGVFGTPMLLAGRSAMPPWWVFAIAVPLSMVGTMLGGRLLDRISDGHFRRYTAWIVTAIGMLYIGKALMEWL